MIQQPIDMTFTDKKFSMIIYGSPGVGKTTLALSAPEPVIIDFDRGLSRVKAYHRKTAIFCANYEEVLHDIESPEIASCQTIIIDTGGSFVTYLQDWAMRTNPTVNKQKNGSISLKGFGAVKSEFSRFTSYIKDILNKNVIYVFHSEEKTDKDGNSQQRLMCEGATKNIVWTPCDFGGYVQMIGNRRVICFTPEQEFFAKGCHGIEGQMEIPAVGPMDKNDFLTRLFDLAKKNIEAENQAFAPVKAQYEAAVAAGQEIISSITDADTANAAIPKIKGLQHALSSEREFNLAFKARIKELGLFYDKVLGQYTPAPSEAK